VSFAGIIGHGRILSLVARAIARDTLPPAILLAGPRGIGKRRVAQAIAEAFNCLEPVHTPLEIDACGRCPACGRVGRGLHPDVLVVEPDDKGTIAIDTIRDVIRGCAYRPFEGRRRVVIVDDADAMGIDPQSALLKTLEEPPPGSVFVLVSSRPDALLPTVRSRCPRLRLSALSNAEVALILERDHGYTPADARAAALDADGSVARALEARAGDSVQAASDAQDLLTLVVRETDGSRRIQFVKELFPKKGSPASEREHLAARLRALASLLRDVSLIRIGVSRDALANGDREEDLARLAQRVDIDRAAHGYAVVDQALAALERNANAKVVADWTVLQL
jgi:DNA polymerase-3 subunit delta'